MKIRIKLTITYVVMATLTCIIGMFAVTNMFGMLKRSHVSVESNMEPIVIIDRIATEDLSMGISYRAVMLFHENSETVQAQINTYNNYWDQIRDDLNNYKTYISKNSASQDEIALYNQLEDIFFNKLKPLTDKVVEAAKNHDMDSAKELMAQCSPYIPVKREIISKLMDMHVDDMRNTNIQNGKVADLSILVTIIITFVAIIIAIVLGVVISNSITKPINQMVYASEEISKGNLNINFMSSNSKDEINMAVESFKKVAATFDMVVNDLNKLSVEHAAGEFEYFMDEKKYSGAFQNMISGVNSVVSMYTGNFLGVMILLENVGKGNFYAPVKQYPGKSSVGNQIVETFRSKLIDVSKQINELGDSAINGNLSARAKESGFEGDWLKMITGLNNVINAVSEPIKEVSAVLPEMARGNLSVKMRGDYKGDFALIKNSLNNTTDEISSYIIEINDVLNQIAVNDNLCVYIKRDYNGDFTSIKAAINLIVDKLNEFMKEINHASAQVASGSKQISESAMSLAEGSAKQASAVDELIAAILSIDKKTCKNAENAKTANDLGAKSKENAAKGNDEMQKMLESMKGIKEASHNISKIIKVIDDIAFQTNLLALNAAVEAARAGEKGKGFAVVAEEVRSLAGRSQNAARETSQMIEDAISKIGDGTIIATNTAESLETIVLNVSEISKIIGDISNSSIEQSGAVSQVVDKISKISQVVQDNSSTSEESAASSEELSSQSEVLKKMVGKFKTLDRR